MSVDISADKVVENTFDNFKKLTPALLAVAIFTGLILFLPASILINMSLDKLPDLWRQVIGIIFLLSIALIVAIICWSIFEFIDKKIKYKRFRVNQRKNLQKLSPSQRQIILELLHSNDKTIRLDRNSGDTIYLLNNFFLHQPDQMFTPGWENEMVLIFVPHPWLLDLYNEEPQLFV